ncbi:Hemolysin activation/secretion protein [Pseudomonas syringae pv. actinidiae]|uniref:Hemolysin activation/secretion protein n=1 Tax=Pseudomonas syringae pv. actinidiae TaxID=103796 RepID=A0AAN4TP42_PSESF|nr:Hemolysin activation/secretion protein [Pseudomonas syringae pv. actinidiae]
MTPVAQFARFLLIMAGKGLHLVLQTLDGLVVGVQRFYFIQQLLLQRGHFARLDTVLARQRIDSIESLFKLLQAGWIGIEMIQKAIQFAYGFFYLDLRTGQQACGLAQGRR